MGGRAGCWPELGAADKLDCKKGLSTSGGDAGGRQEGVKSSWLLAWPRSVTPSLPGTPQLPKPAVRAHKHRACPMATGKERSPFVLKFQRGKP